MKKSEKILLVGTIGIGVVLAATSLSGKGRSGSTPGGQVAGSAAGEATAGARPPATLELLAAKRAELKPLAPGMRNPFRPVEAAPLEVVTPQVRSAREIGAEKVAALRLTGIFKEAGQLAALVDGKVVRAGDEIGGLKVVQVTARGVVLEYQGERFSKPLHKRSKETDKPDEGSSTPDPGETEPANR